MSRAAAPARPSSRRPSPPKPSRRSSCPISPASAWPDRSSRRYCPTCGGSWRCPVTHPPLPGPSLSVKVYGHRMPELYDCRLSSFFSRLPHQPWKSSSRCAAVTPPWRRPCQFPLLPAPPRSRALLHCPLTVHRRPASPDCCQPLPWSPRPHSPLPQRWLTQPWLKLSVAARPPSPSLPWSRPPLARRRQQWSWPCRPLKRWPRQKPSPTGRYRQGQPLRYRPRPALPSCRAQKAAPHGLSCRRPSVFRLALSS